MSRLSRDKNLRCAVCRVFVTRQNSFSPVSCNLKFGSAAHRICLTCWFKGKAGKIPFAAEYGSHKCPGCLMKLPFSPVERKKSLNLKSRSEIIVLSNSN